MFRYRCDLADSKPKRVAFISGAVTPAIGIVAGGIYLTRQAEQEIAVVIPELSQGAMKGMATFETYCVSNVTANTLLVRARGRRSSLRSTGRLITGIFRLFAP